MPIAFTMPTTMLFRSLVLGLLLPVAACNREPVAQSATPSQATPSAPAPSKPEPVAGRDVSSWAKVLRVDPDPNVVTDAEARAKIVASGWPWRVEDKASGIVLLLVPPGEFTMGSPASEEGRDDNEKPHRRRITQAFYLGETEVTQASWQRVMGNNPSQFQGPSNPVEQISWDEIQPFLQKTGLSLPSEAQWEYACRAGTTTAYWFGNGASDGRGTGNYFGPATKSAKGWDLESWSFDDGFVETAPVGKFRANRWGFVDMHGNICEWCADRYGVYPGDRATEAPSASALRVLRGGAWTDGPASCRSATRGGFEPVNLGGSLGFRAARAL